jgi:hypothetical protein
VGTADFCGATVSIAGGASNRSVTVNLPDTNLMLIGVRTIPAVSRGAFTISDSSFQLGGSQYRFTLNAVRSNPRRARIILLFAARGAGAPTPVRALRGSESFDAIFSVGGGMIVSIQGGGGGTSNCTIDETSPTFTTQGNNEKHRLGFFARIVGSCAFEPSWSQFKVVVKDSSGTTVGTGTMEFGSAWPLPDYKATCKGDFKGISCEKLNNRGLRITRP